MFKRLRADIEAAKNNDPAARNKFEIWLTYSGVHALSWHRFANRLYKMHLKLLARMVSQLAKFLTGIEIHPAAKIEGGVFIDHGMGVVIGETAEVKSGVVIYQGVTLGGTGKEKGKRHPTIEKNVILSAGAKVLGGFTVGEGAKIGAGAVVLKEVPPHATVVGVPGRVVRIRGEKPDLLQEKTDPNAEEIRALKCRIHKLEAALEKLTGEKFECTKEELFPCRRSGKRTRITQARKTAMNKITSKELRSKWLSFYESKGHVNIGAVSLIGDGTTGVMFNVAGMQPLMPYLLGKPHPAGKRLCNVQGCVRTVDIESVGDATHFTFFEMMGNWSLGDYFKKEKTAWSFELLTKVFGLDKDKICSTVFAGNESAPRDDETAELLVKLGIRRENISIWTSPTTGGSWKARWAPPAGRTTSGSTPSPTRNAAASPATSTVPAGGTSRSATTCTCSIRRRKTAMFAGKQERRHRIRSGPHARFLNGLTDGYKTDLFSGAIAYLEKVSGKKYDDGGEDRKAMRIIADHTRTTVMLIGDVNGILPSNTGAGYILRRLMRRAIRYCRAGHSQHGDAGRGQSVHRRGLRRGIPAPAAERGIHSAGDRPRDREVRIHPRKGHQGI